MEKITIQTIINEPVEKVWDAYTSPAHITKWNHATNDWHCPRAENDLRVGGRFVSRMEAKDGSGGFDYSGTYDAVETHKRIDYTLDDARKVTTAFQEMGNSTAMTIVFEAENENPAEIQRIGWQMILDNFKLYVENL